MIQIWLCCEDNYYYNGMTITILSLRLDLLNINLRFSLMFNDEIFYKNSELSLWLNLNLRNYTRHKTNSCLIARCFQMRSEIHFWKYFCYIWETGWAKQDRKWMWSLLLISSTGLEQTKHIPFCLWRWTVFFKDGLISSGHVQSSQSVCCRK